MVTCVLAPKASGDRGCTGLVGAGPAEVGGTGTAGLAGGGPVAGGGPLAGGGPPVDGETASAGLVCEELPAGLEAVTVQR